MQIQLNTDNHLEGSERLAAAIDALVRDPLARFEDRLTRIEVHLADENSHKGGERDKRCMLEARPRGLPPISVEHKASTLELAASGAADKLARALEHAFGKAESARGHGGRGGATVADSSGDDKP